MKLSDPLENILSRLSALTYEIGSSTEIRKDHREAAILDIQRAINNVEMGYIRNDE